MATETTTTTPGTTGTTWTAPPPSEPRLHAVLERLESARALDGPAEKVAKAVRGSLPAGGLKDLLSGKPLGHPLHPALTDVVIGTWTSATILDLIGGSKARPAAERLIGVGILAALLPNDAADLGDRHLVAG